MTYSTEQLLLAAAVRELAVTLRSEAHGLDWDAQFATTPESELLTPSQRNEWEVNWRQANPMDTFMLEALKRIKQAADFIARHET